MEKIDKAAIELLEKLPPEMTAKLSSFGVTIPTTWSALSEADKLVWLDQNREVISKLIKELSEHLEIVSRALVSEAGPMELMKLWKYARKAS
jgi:hypothetical protein